MILDESHIRWRVIIVSACYSGIFIPVLKNDSTLIMTAADSRHSSFGCDDTRDLTYFGEALLQRCAAARLLAQPGVHRHGAHHPPARGRRRRDPFQSKTVRRTARCRRGCRCWMRRRPAAAPYRPRNHPHDIEAHRGEEEIGSDPLRLQDRTAPGGDHPRRRRRQAHEIAPAEGAATPGRKAPAAVRAGHGTQPEPGRRSAWCTAMGARRFPGAFAHEAVSWVRQAEQLGTGHAVMQAAPGLTRRSAGADPLRRWTADYDVRRCGHCCRRPVATRWDC